MLSISRGLMTVCCFYGDVRSLMLCDNTLLSLVRTEQFFSTGKIILSCSFKVLAELPLLVVQLSTLLNREPG